MVSPGLMPKSTTTTAKFALGTAVPLCVRGVCLTIHRIVFVHGLRGHPRQTWEATTSASPSGSSSDTTEKAKGFKSLFRRRSKKSPATDVGEVQAPSSTPKSSPVFWPEDYLALDIPEAEVWTYGYNADVIGDLFQANNKNSISQHGRDLSVRLQNDIGDGVRLCQPVFA
jgi:hypothetical protein